MKVKPKVSGNLTENWLKMMPIVREFDNKRIEN